MNPVLSLTLGSWQVNTSSYRLFFILAAVATVALGTVVAHRRGLPARRCMGCLLPMAAAVPVGARIMDAATKRDLYMEDPSRLWALDLTGFSMFGGLLLASAVGIVACRRLRIDLVRLADSVAPALSIGIALMRVGCFEAGCCFGEVCVLPWAVTFPAGSEAHLYQMLTGGGIFSLGSPLPVHPTQLYEAAAALLGCGLTFWILAGTRADGTAFLFFAGWYSGFRLVNHLFRVPGSSLAVSDQFYPILYATVLFAAATTLIVRARPAPCSLQSCLGRK
ncbi:MAG: prolipoprotein diacylglyceryl transferase [Chloroflexi bacterium]|nr:prolipoprotein diacylglyceryl transferase [Chloroflexota bacterium]